MSERIVRVGVLGAGAWARGAHLPGYRRDPRCRLVAIADPERDRAEAAAREFDIPHASTDSPAVTGPARARAPAGRALARRPDIGVIAACPRSHTRFDRAWAALEAGKHVLCEKP